MDSSKIISLEDASREANRYPTEEEALEAALRLCDLLEPGGGSYPLLNPGNVYIENDTRWVTANPPLTADLSEALYHLGAVLHFLVTRASFQVSYYLDGPMLVRQRNPQISVRFEAIVTRLLENVRSLRYSGIAELREDLVRLQKELAGDWTISWPCFKGNGTRSNCISAPRRKQPSSVGLLKEVWRAPVGEIWSSPVSAGECLFVGSGDGSFYCVDSGTGKIVWKLPLAARIESTACIAGNFAYLGNDLGVFYAINIRNGSVQWKRTLGEYIRSSAFCCGGNIYVGSINPTRKTGILWALSAQNGAVLWKRALGPVFASPLVDRDAVIVGSDDETLYSFDTSGSENWKVALSGKIRSTAVLVRESLYVGGFGGTLYKIRRSTGEVAWRNAEAGSMYSSPAYGRSFVVVGNNSGVIKFFLTGTGKKKAEFATRGPVTASPLVANGLVFVGSNDGRFYVLSPQGEMLASFDANAPINSSAYYQEGMVFFGSDKGLIALSL
jgi:outer membrane protein assembly factor BamB